MKLKVLKWYANQHVAYRPGDVIEVDEAQAEFLQRDAPDCFEVVKVKQVKAPAKDKAVKSPARAKAKK